MYSHCLDINGTVLVVEGLFPRVARLRSEYFSALEEPGAFVEHLRATDVGVDVFTFIEQLTVQGQPRPYRQSWERKAVLKIASYQNWWKDQINDKTRNMVRKAGKKGVAIDVARFDQELVQGIKEIYDESPLRQGRPFPHYGKDLTTIERENATFLDRSEFIAARYDGSLIGFAKLVHLRKHSALMQIVALNKHRDKAPTNALIAKAVEMCADRQVPYLMYGTWSRRTLGDFKKHHGFECMTIPRYFVPLNVRGRVALALRLHRSLVEQGVENVPEGCLRFLASLRDRCYSLRYRTKGL